MENVYDEMVKEHKKKSMKFYRSFWALMTAQFTVGYHAIYNVEWLGWDLVEPLTYTSG